jgi:AraC-like DNA-binding protein
MTDISESAAANDAGFVGGPTADYVQDLESVGLGLHDWRSEAKAGIDREPSAPLIYRSWSDGAMGIFATDTKNSSVQIETEATQDLLALGIQLGSEYPAFRLGNSPFSGQGLDVICLPRGSRLQMSTNRNGLCSVALLIHIDALAATCDVVDRELPSIVRKIWHERTPFSAKAALPLAIQRTARGLIDETPSAAFQRLYRRAKMTELLWLVMNHLRRADLLHQGQGAIANHVREGVERVRRFIENDPTRDATIDELGRVAGMNRTSLRLLFKRMHGATIFDYRQALIMKLADDMLRQPDCTISEIGYRLGYREPSSFTSAYKRFWGHSPGELRRRRH